MITVVNKYDIEIDFDAAVELMDDEIREHIHNTFPSSGTPQLFFRRYCMLHSVEYGEEFECDKKNPVW